MTETKTNLATLLCEWAAIEPDRCDLNEDAEIFSVANQDVWFPLSDRIVRLPVLQSAVQEAIEARGWGWSAEQMRLDTDSPKYEVCVETYAMPFFAGSNDTPAAALLSAYLQALKAQ